MQQGQELVKECLDATANDYTENEDSEGSDNEKNIEEDTKEIPLVSQILLPEEVYHEHVDDATVEQQPLETATTIAHEQDTSNMDDGFESDQYE